MAKAKRRPQDEELRMSSEEDDIDPEVLDIMESIAGLPTESAKIMLFRMPEGDATKGPGGRPAFIAAIEPSAFSPERIAEQYGGGRFIFKAVKDGEVVKRGEFFVEGVRKLPQREDPKPETPPGRSDNFLESAILRLTQQVDSIAKQNQQEMLKVMLAFMGETQKNKAPELTADELEDRIMARMERMKNLFGGGSGMTDILSMVRSIMELTNAAEMPPWMMVVDKLGPMLERITTPPQAAANAGGNAPPPRHLRPIPKPPQRPEPEPEREPVPPAAEADWITDLIVRFGNLFVGAASRDSNPEPYADIVLDNVVPENRESFKEWLSSPQWFADLCKRDPRIQLQYAWWSDLRGMILEGFEPPREPTSAGQETGDSVSEESGE